MKKKILSTLLAVAMFASVAVPAFAKDTSTQEGDPAKITMLEFRDGAKVIESVDIKQDEEVDLLEKLMAWQDKDTLILDKNQIVWEIRDTQSIFNMESDGHITATEPKGSATVIARDGEKQNVVAKITVNAKPNSKEVYANSWKFDKANYDVIYTNGTNISEGLTIKAVSVPADSILTDANKAQIKNAVRNAIAEKISVDGSGTSAQYEIHTRFSVNLDALTGANFQFGGAVSTLAEDEAESTTTHVVVDMNGTKNKAKVIIDALTVGSGENAEVKDLIWGDVKVSLEIDPADKNGNTLILEMDDEYDTTTTEVKEWLGLPGYAEVKKIADKKVAIRSLALPAGVTVDNLFTMEENDSSVSFKISPDFLTGVQGYKEGEKLSITAETYKFSDKDGNGAKKVTAKTNLITKAAVNATKVSVLPSKTIEVGETFKLGDTLKYGGSKANVLKDVEAWYEAPLNNDAEVDDYAIVDNDGVVTGVKTGKNRIYVKTTAGTAYCTVTVVPKGTVDKVDDHNAVLKVKDVTVSLGGTQWIDLYNIDADSIVKWTSSDEAVAKVVGNKENKGSKIWGLKEGTATLTLTVDGDVAATLTVTVKGAATENNKPGATDNAQTGDTLFSNLF